MNLAAAFASSVAQHRDKTAIFWGEAKITYAMIDAQSSWLARRLVDEHRVAPGERVAIWLKNSPEFIPVLFAILKTGAVVVPINNFLKPDEVSYILRDSGAKVIVTEDAQADAITEIQLSVPELSAVFTSAIPPVVAPAPEFALSDRAENDLAVIIYTSGTTGRPKGAMLTHGNLLHNVESCRIVLAAV